MRAVQTGDLLAAARCLLAVAPRDRAALARQLLIEAHAADKYVKRLRKLHPQWGDGSLRGACRGRDHAFGRALSDAGYRECHVLVLAALDARPDAG
ncbi:hypothetical protein [Sulfitobacter sp. S190]|uniref:DUF7742 family protein n=1 Tax=Sulfitobacter sp. S190 TaxID=2867022 RepID=UPI0021A670DE|nr:hypothetical protein [Sulfitobacter sp. S190]UWR21033.1 hypothetical protein K3756_09895 [Sulfitobacter sp. S190]